MRAAQDTASVLRPCETPRAPADLPPRNLMPAGSESGRFRREIALTLGFIAFTVAAWLTVTAETLHILWRRLDAGDFGGSAEQMIFIIIIQTLLYGNLVYQLTRLGYLKRRLAHRPLSPDERERLYENRAPALTILVPSYKEEPAVVRRTLLSAALQDYPDRRVVLLIDDPTQPASAADAKALAAMRGLPAEIQRLLAEPAAMFRLAQTEYEARKARGDSLPINEASNLAMLYEWAANWLEGNALGTVVTDHADRLFMDAVVGRAARAHRERAEEMRHGACKDTLRRARIDREYQRLVSLFRVNMASFERKRYVNLSHEPNKAMNLNSYIGLLGQTWREVRRADGLHLEPDASGEGALQVPAADFLITLDADSLLVPEYALVLVNEMLRPHNQRLAVAQTPYNTFPNPPGLLERVAGATTDIQYIIHQGFTAFDATYWVGANALLRVAALNDIKEVASERGYEVPVFIQDRTVIEDTESSVDLVAREWRLYNYPERLAFSATPPDFGSLLIQRRRWANGGLIILPKLLRYLARQGDRKRKLREGLFRIHYLGSIAAVNVGLLVLLGHSFEHSVESAWLPLTALPYFFLYGRDLRYSGYRLSDLPRVYALNLLLIPINLGGVAKSLQQAFTGQRTPFARTPKVSGRTSAPAFYIIAEYALVLAWALGSLLDLQAGRWFSAVFGLVHAAMLGYAIASFIGWRESWEDIGLALRAASLPSPIRASLLLPKTAFAVAAWRPQRLTGGVSAGHDRRRVRRDTDTNLLLRRAGERRQISRSGQMRNHGSTTGVPAEYR